jgi:hypothetical protein
LSDRIVLNPFAAKRLWMLLSAILKEYESRFGVMQIDAGASGQPGSTNANKGSSIS